MNLNTRAPRAGSFLLFLFVLAASAGNSPARAGAPNAAPPPRQEGLLFRFKLEKDDVLTVDKYQDILIGYGHRRVSKEEKNRIVLKVLRKEEDGAVLEGHFTTYSRTPRGSGPYRLETRYFSRFKILNNGRYIVPGRYFMPNLRDLPAFPNRPLKKADRWILPAIETMKFGGALVSIPVRARYLYEGLSPLPLEAGKKRAPGEFHRLRYAYTINKKVRSRLSPVRHVQGFSADRLWFDEKEGVPVFDSNRLSYTFLMRNGRAVEYRFKILSWYRKIRRIKPREKKRIIDEVKKDLKNDKQITVRKNKEGVVLNMDAVLFAYNSARLNPRSVEKLRKIAKILKKYPNREIRVSGHTDSHGPARYNKILSRRRARAALEALRRMGVNVRRMSYRGYGETRPVAPNTTPQGRAKNRRVEILIVTE